jgi:hypothetical protein
LTAIPHEPFVCSWKLLNRKIGDNMDASFWLIG